MCRELQDFLLALLIWSRQGSIESFDGSRHRQSAVLQYWKSLAAVCFGAITRLVRLALCPIWIARKWRRNWAAGGLRFDPDYTAHPLPTRAPVRCKPVRYASASATMPPPGRRETSCWRWKIYRRNKNSNLSMRGVGAVIDRPPNYLLANNWNFRRKSYMIAYRR